MLRTNYSQKIKFFQWKQIYSGLVVGLFTIIITSYMDEILDSLITLFTILPWESLGGAFFIFCLRLLDVPIGTLKTVLMVRGMRTWATLLGLLEVMIWLTAMGKVMGQLDNPWNIAGYALGYSAGTWLGMWIENRLAFGSVEVHTISLTKSKEVADVIRATGYGVTQFQGHGDSGSVSIIGTIAERKHMDGLLKRIQEVDPNAFVTVDDTRQVIGGHRPGK